MHIEQNAPPRAAGRRAVAFATPESRQAYEDEFLHLYELRRALDATLCSMASVLDAADEAEADEPSPPPIGQCGRPA